ncbi:Pentatricopeptide repeat-containing protein, mitochondrial [Sesamum alatum]|uniref:Pentatricopeptide repeat-containing protein, mitochondrial n=1 Tax=Sesamum alatum TaxID=300844 RepID=A0AAE1YA17_9LAMI|nr:Pentatricopeptide repeat-containing protein, mitochondrial [Sesamum alatum]
MLRIVSPFHPKDPYYKRVRSILSQIFFYAERSHFSTESLIENPQTPSSSKANHTHEDLSSLKFSGIAETVISKCSRLWDTNKGEGFSSFSLKDYLLRLSDISPEVVRRFWRVSVLKPQDVLEMLLGFESCRGKYEVEVKKVESLWGVFKWASEQTGEFEHFPRSCKIMAAMLVRVGFFKEVEYLLSRRESQRILLDCQEVLSNLIEGYVGEFELDKAVSVYGRMRRLSLVPSMSSYRALLKYLVELNEIKLLYYVYMDAIKMGMVGVVEESGIHENVIRLLCMDGKVQEARDIVRKVMNYGIKPSKLVVNAISCGYCDKKDYSDLLSFFAEVRIVPDVVVGNKILFSSCRNFGVEQACMYLQKLEELGFCPDEITLGILIASDCSKGKLKNAFFYVSDLLSRGLKPHVYSYNALLSGMFKEGMWTHSRDILVEMSDMGVTPDLSTFRVLLAGFCKARQFHEVKAIICEMAEHNLVTLSSSEDPLTKGFMLLGLSPLDVKIRRDNDKGFSKTEFFDNLGNGLYLDTDLEEFEKRISLILDDAMMPDFNSSIIEKCHSLDIKCTLTMVDEMARWGQAISLPALSSILNRLCRAPFTIETINHLLGIMSKSTYELDEKTLNMLVQTYSKKGFTFRARTLLDGMVRRGNKVENSTYTALLFDISKKRDLRSLRYCCKLAQKSNWSTDAKDGKALLSYLCQNKWLNEAFELFETMLFVGPYDISNTFQSLLGELCHQGFTSTARFLLEEFSNQATISDHIAYSLLVSGFCQEKRFTDALKMFETMISKGLSPPLDASIQLITQLCRNQNYEKAVELKNVYLRDQPSAVLPMHCALINGFCKSGRVEEAASLFKEVSVKGLIPDVDVFNSLVEGYCGVNNLKKVKEVLGVMIRKSLTISISSYSNMVRLIRAEGKFRLALSLKQLMLQVTYLPEHVLYNILIFHFSSTRDSLLLNAVIDAFQKNELQFDEVTYNFVIRGFLLCKDVSRSLHYLTTMIRQDIRPSNRSLREVIMCLCHNRELSLALNLSREMELRGWVHGSVIQNNIVEALLTNGNLHEAVEFLDRISSKDLIPDKIMYDYLIKQFYQHGRLDKAVGLLNIMLLKGSHPESTSYDYVIQGFCNGHKLDTALDFYAEMLYRGLKPSTITWDILVRSLCEHGRAQEAETILKTMIELGETPSREAFQSVINRYRSEKNTSKTSELLKVMQQKGYVPDFDTHWSLISNLSNSSKKDDRTRNSSFLSNLLSGFGFAQKNSNSKTR